MRRLTLLLALALLTPSSKAADAVKINFDQDSASCAAIDHWDVYDARITTTTPNPVFTGATKLGSLTNIAPLTCGLGASGTLPFATLGSFRFWMIAVANASNGGGPSPVSNSVDATFPLVAPVLKSATP